VSYAEFLRAKATVASVDGFPIDESEVNPILKPHQSQLVQWAVRGGRRAIFAAFGTGKTIIQLEAVRLILSRAGGKALIVCPLGVHQEFEHDAAMLGLELHRIRTTEQALALPDGAIALTNYEPVRDGKLDPNVFAVASLDEAAILRSYGSKTFQTFLTLFDAVAYRFVATATPSPNRFKELLHYAGFLGVMDTGQALTRFFKRDSTQANNLTLLESQAANFWLWLSSWSAWVQTPADLCDCGCHDDGHPGCAACGCADYVLPELELREHEIQIDHLARENVERNTGQTYLLADSAMSLQAAAAEKRATIPARVEQVLRILDGYGATGDLLDQAIVYCHLNDEQRALEQAFADAGYTCSSIDGSMETAEAQRRLAEWRSGATQLLLGKPVMLGVGLNLQQANKMIFAGIDYRFHDTIQAVHRIQRFGQRRACEVHLIYADSEREVLKVLLEKWRQHEELTSTMTELIHEHGLSRASVEQALTRSLGVERVEVSGEGWRLVNNDCVPELAAMPDASAGLVVTSIPFSNHYEYTPAFEDFGFTESNDHFWEQMGFLTSELLRVLQPGRLYCCHVKDRILFGNVTGPRRSDHARPRARLRLPRHGHRRHRRRPGEQPDLSARLVRAVQGRDEDGRRLARIHPALPQAAERPLEGLRRCPGGQVEGRLHARPLADRRACVLALFRRPPPDVRRAGGHGPGSARQGLHRADAQAGLRLRVARPHRRGARRARQAAGDVHGDRAGVAPPGCLARRQPHAHAQRRAVAARPDPAHLPAAARHR
jgi:hypothetical protein